MSSQAWSGPWDQGLRWRSVKQSVDQAFLPLSVDFVSQRVLRVKNDGAEDDLIEDYIKAATELCTWETKQTIWPTTFHLYLSDLPWSDAPIVLPERPVLEVVSISYYDSDNVLQDYGGSPPSWIVTPGGDDGKTTIHLGAGESWPTGLSTRDDAVIVEYTAGYASGAEIPQLLKTGIGLVVGELYKSPDLSNDLGLAANVLGLARFWPRKY